MSVKRRLPITLEQKHALRDYAQRHPHLKHGYLAQWFGQQHGRVINKSVISRILRIEKLTPLPNDASRHTIKRVRRAHWPELEAALKQWITRADHSTPITGDAIKAKAVEFWSLLPQYAGQPTPSFSHGWLENFNRRTGPRPRRSHAQAQAQAQPVDGIIAQTDAQITAEIAARVTAGEGDIGDGEADTVERISVDQGLAALERVRLYEIQSADCNTAWISILETYEKALKKRRQLALRQASAGSGTAR